MTIAQDIKRYLKTGRYDGNGEGFPGQNTILRLSAAHDAMIEALVAQVTKRAAGKQHVSVDVAGDVSTFARTKVEPMVRGLFPVVEQATVLSLLQRSVVFVTTGNIEALLRAESFLHGAWDLANLYLHGVGGKLLGPDAPELLGISQGTTCFVSPWYFAEEDPYADFIVHECAHTFHNCKRKTAGLPEKRSCEWLLPIAFRERETFAYSCEAYSRIVAAASTRAERLRLAEVYAERRRIPDDRADPVRVAAILKDAAAAKNGWKVILAACAEPSRRKLRVGA